MILPSLKFTKAEPIYHRSSPLPSQSHSNMHQQLFDSKIRCVSAHVFPVVILCWEEIQLRENVPQSIFNPSINTHQAFKEAEWHKLQIPRPLRSSDVICITIKEGTFHVAKKLNAIKSPEIFTNHLESNKVLVALAKQKIPSIPPLKIALWDEDCFGLIVRSIHDKWDRKFISMEIIGMLLWSSQLKLFMFSMFHHEADISLSYLPITFPWTWKVFWFYLMESPRCCENFN